MRILFRSSRTAVLRRAVAALLASATLAGCSWTQGLISSDKIDYKSEGKQSTAPSLEIPPDLTAPTREDRFSVPGDRPRSATASGQTKGGPVPASLGVLPAVKNARIDRAGGQRWLVVQAKPDELWPIVKEFWQENGFILDIERPESGVMETDWAENRAKIGTDAIRRTLGRILDSLYSTPERDKFRTRLEANANGETDIFISHRGMIEIYKTEGRDQTVWQPRPADPELEADFLRRLMVRLGTDAGTAQKVLEAGARPPERAKLVRTGADSVVEIEDTFDRAWRRVGLALDRVGFTVEDRDRTKGLYFVRYADPDAGEKKSDGFLGRMTDFLRKTPEKTAEQYQVLVRDARTTTQIAVLSKTGAAENSATTQRILGLLHEQLK